MEYWVKGQLSLLPAIPAYALFIVVCLAFSTGASLILFALCERWYFRNAKPILSNQDMQERPDTIPFAARKAA